MAVFNIEVLAESGGWRWHFIAPCGRPLQSSARTFADDLEAFTDAKHRRTNAMREASAVDDYRCHLFG